MASSSNPSSFSSSSVPTSRRTYDIFLSFRGEDTRNTFVDHLYDALVRRGIHTFKDDQMLGGGKLISQSLLKAIRESKYAVVVFSKDYENSSWCLKELSEIMECHYQMGLKVLPVFYHLDPSDVRNQKGCFATAFEEHELNLNGERNDVNKWRKALTAAASLSGYHISPVSGGETATINNIVQEILGDIEPCGRENDLIGIESHLDALYPLLSIEAIDEVRFIGIFGMGGIGKTTIARALFGKIAYWFEGSSFINDIRENSCTKRDICALQEKMLTDGLGVHHKFMIQDPEYGANMIKERFCNKKVFLVLDNVDNVTQLEFLAATHEWFGLGSRIIITTRDEHLLLDAHAKYKPVFLRMDQALELFSRHAFKTISPPDKFKELSNRVIRYTGYLPLALKVLGSFFRGRVVDEWESALDRLAKTPNSEILGTLKLSFDGLEEFEKKIFLDVACFFKGRELDDVTRVLDSFDFCARIGVTSLVEKSLLTLTENRLDMHDLIQEMGWQVVRQSARDSRLRNHEKFHDIIMESKKLELVEAIVNTRERNWPNKLESIEAIVNPREQHWPKELEIIEIIMNWWGQSVFLKKGCCDDAFKSMKNLRLLHVYRNFTCHKPTFLPNELRWLRWDEYPFSSLPLANTCKLVGLEMTFGNIKHLWEGQKIMPNLKLIKLEHLDHLSSFPDVLKSPNIERLVLSNCVNLVEIHESIGLLKRLVYLDISKCKNLKCLPSKFEMESLETLVLCRCFSLKVLPEFSTCMIKLSHIDVSYCYSLEELPSSIRNISNLSMLNLRRCRSLNNIPNSICELKCLMTLSLHGCLNLMKLPHEFGNMKNLQELHVGQAKSIFYDLTNLGSLRKLDLSLIQIGDQDFPINLYGLSSLEELSLRHNSKLIQLPASISHLPHLKHLDLSGCRRLESVNGLPSGIQVFDASYCFSLEVLKDLLEEYECLHKIHLFGCKKLLENKESEIYLDNMLNHSFLKKWAAKDGCISIAIPGSKIPSWFKEQQNFSKIALKLPFKWQTKIIGFAICGVIRQTFSSDFSCIKFIFENGETLVPMLEVDCVNASTTAAVADDENENVWIGYVPLSLFQNMHHYDDDFEGEHWYRIIQGNLIIELTSAYGKAIRCGARVVYKEVESSQQVIKPAISSSYYWQWKLTRDRWSQNTIVFGE